MQVFFSSFPWRRQQSGGPPTKVTSELEFVEQIASWILKHRNLNGVTDTEIVELISRGKLLLEKERSFIQVKTPVLLFGDIHGNFVDLLEHFKYTAPELLSLEDPGINLLFLGDYVDRGPDSLEVAILLVCLKLLFPKRISLLRGNHESSDINKQCRHSFYQDVLDKRNGNYTLKSVALFSERDIWARFNRLFKELPLCALVSRHVLCMHGGIPQIEHWKQLEFVKKPNQISDCYDDPVPNDLLWSDPTNNSKLLNDENFFHNEDRLTSIKFNDVYIQEFMERYPAIKCIVRGHEHVNTGYKLNDARNLCTLFSAPRYERKTDSGSVMKIWEEESSEEVAIERFRIEFYTLRPEQGNAKDGEDQHPVEPSTPRPSFRRADA